MPDTAAVQLTAPVRAALVIMAFLAVFAALSVSREISAPLLLAFVVAVVLGPVQDGLCRLGLRGSLAATLILLVMLVGGAALILAAEPLVRRVAAEVPTIRWELRELVWEARGALRGLETINEDLQSVMGNGGEGEAAPAADGPELPTAFDAALLAPIILGQVLIFFATLYFALTARQTLYATISATVGGAPLRNRIDRAERRVARYFGTITLINAGLGVAVALALSLIGMPLPIVWGFAAALVNFLLYIGPAMLAGALLLAGLINFDGAMVFAPMGIYLMLNGMEAQFVTPSLVGRNMRLNPLFVFLAVVFWLWLWGPVGGIVAIPVLLYALALNEDFVAIGRPAAVTA